MRVVGKYTKLLEGRHHSMEKECYYSVKDQEDKRDWEAFVNDEV